MYWWDWKQVKLVLDAQDPFPLFNRLGSTRIDGQVWIRMAHIVTSAKHHLAWPHHTMRIEWNSEAGYMLTMDPKGESRGLCRSWLIDTKDLPRMSLYKDTLAAHWDMFTLVITNHYHEIPILWWPDLVQHPPSQPWLLIPSATWWVNSWSSLYWATWRGNRRILASARWMRLCSYQQKYLFVFMLSRLADSEKWIYSSSYWRFH